MNGKMICSMIVAAAMVTGVSVASVAHAEGEDGITCGRSGVAGGERER